MLLGEATSNAELQEYLEEYDKDWYIGLEKDPEWTSAILESKPNLFALGHNNTQVIIGLSTLSLGESFQDYSWIQDFEADFP